MLGKPQHKGGQSVDSTDPGGKASRLIKPVEKPDILPRTLGTVSTIMRSESTAVYPTPGLSSGCGNLCPGNM